MSVDFRDPAMEADALAIMGGEPAVPFPGPHAPWPPPATLEELESLAWQRNFDILIRGRTGPVAEFEDAFRDFLEGRIRYAITFNSGTSALYAAFVGVGVEPGTEVIGPALTYHGALSPVFALGGSVRLADVDAQTRCIDPDALEDSITPSTRAVVVVHQWGHPADMDRILPIVRRRGLKLIEDCSHAHGSAYRGQLCGTFGDAAIFSLQAKKAVYAGEGGILVTNDEEIMSRAILLGHPRERSAELASEHARLAATGFGMKLRMSPFAAIVAIHSLRNFGPMKENRHRCLQYLNKRIAEVDYLEGPHSGTDVDMGAWYGFKPLYRPDLLEGISRQRLVKALLAEGLTVRIPSDLYLADLPLFCDASNPMMPRLKGKAPLGDADYPRARRIADHLIDLPTFSDWETGKPIMDAYIEGLLKVKRHARALADLQT